MTATHTLTEAQINELARAMRAAMQAARTSGYASSSYVHDHRTHESILHRRRDEADKASETASQAMWAMFYDVMSRDVVDVPPIEPAKVFEL